MIIDRNILGAFFLTLTYLITFSVSANAEAGGPQKIGPTPLNNQTQINNKHVQLKRVEYKYVRATKYSGGDPDTERGLTPNGPLIKPLTDMGLKTVAVDTRKIPYGSVIIYNDYNNQRQVGVAVDKGSDVTVATAAKSLAKRKGFSTSSPEYNASVIDVFGDREPAATHWVTITVIHYEGPDFRFGLKASEKLAYLRWVKQTYLTNKA